MREEKDTNQQFLNSAEAAELARLNRVVFVRKAHAGEAPEPFEGSGKKLWDRDDIIAWIKGDWGGQKSKIGAPTSFQKKLNSL